MTRLRDLAPDDKFFGRWGEWGVEVRGKVVEQRGVWTAVVVNGKERELNAAAEVERVNDDADHKTIPA